jgi:hypothetical protein
MYGNITVNPPHIVQLICTNKNVEKREHCSGGLLKHIAGSHRIVSDSVGLQKDPRILFLTSPWMVLILLVQGL